MEARDRKQNSTGNKSLLTTDLILSFLWVSTGTALCFVFGAKFNTYAFLSSTISAILIFSLIRSLNADLNLSELKLRLPIFLNRNKTNQSLAINAYPYVVILSLLFFLPNLISYARSSSETGMLLIILWSITAAGVLVLNRIILSKAAQNKATMVTQKRLENAEINPKARKATKKIAKISETNGEDFKNAVSKKSALQTILICGTIYLIYKSVIFSNASTTLFLTSAVFWAVLIFTKFINKFFT